MMLSAFDVFSYQFMRNALVVGILVSLCAALLGVSLVLKKYAMIGDGLSHVGFGALAIATCIGWAPLAVAIPVVIVVAFLLLRISSKSKTSGDALIAIVSATSLAIGVFAMSASKGSNIDVYNYMFGSIVAISNIDLIITVILSIFVIAIYFICYNTMFSITFDETFAKTSGVKVDFFTSVLAILTAVIIVVGMKMMGALLISSLVIFPSISAMYVCKKYKTVVLTSAIISVLAFITGLMVSYWVSTPCGSSVVLINAGILIVMKCISLVKGRS